MTVDLLPLRSSSGRHPDGLSTKRRTARDEDQQESKKARKQLRYERKKPIKEERESVRQLSKSKARVSKEIASEHHTNNNKGKLNTRYASKQNK